MKNEVKKEMLPYEQSEDANLLEERGEGRKVTLRERELVNCTIMHEEGGEEGKVILLEREIFSCTDPHEEAGKDGKTT